MGREPSNAASERARHLIQLLNDRDRMMSDRSRAIFAPGGIRYDHRRVIAQPPADGDQWFDQILGLEALIGRWPRLTVTEVLAVRGDRLVASAMEFELGEMGRLDYIMVSRYDEMVDRIEVVHQYDPEQRDEALAQLDRLHAELGGN